MNPIILTLTFIGAATMMATFLLLCFGAAVSIQQAIQKRRALREGPIRPLQRVFDQDNRRG